MFHVKSLIRQSSTPYYLYSRQAYYMWDLYVHTYAVMYTSAVHPITEWPIFHELEQGLNRTNRFQYSSGDYVMLSET